MKVCCLGMCEDVKKVLTVENQLPGKTEKEAGVTAFAVENQHTHARMKKELVNP